MHLWYCDHMIIANTNPRIVAIFELEAENESFRSLPVHVAAWSDDGEPLVIGVDRLIRARSVPEFSHLDEEPDPQKIGAQWSPTRDMLKRYQEGRV